MPTERRVRSYLDSNCAHCHGALELERSRWDARYSTPLEEQGIVGGVLLGEYEGDGNHVVTPRDPQSSILYRRVVSVDRDLRMPPLGRSEQDSRFIDVLGDWIVALDDETTPPTTLPAQVCGDPVAAFGLITVTDALAVLQTVVNARSCAPCVCDVNQDGDVTVSDALIVLQRATDASVTLRCNPCG